MQFVQINASTKQDRHVVTAQVKDAIVAAGGWVTGFQQFSNVSVCIQFEMEAACMARLFERLEGLELQLSEASRRLPGELTAKPETELMGTFQLTFFHSDPDERMVIPAVPG
ncbi:MAG: hypothetical protein J0H49_16815 [Acidobacteria bacterium]|nr:hypothetical protein [Acidobacteriota bacterium]